MRLYTIALASVLALVTTLAGAQPATPDTSSARAAKSRTGDPAASSANPGADTTGMGTSKSGSGTSSSGGSDANGDQGLENPSNGYLGARPSNKKKQD